jgi:hypothetical protein
MAIVATTGTLVGVSCRKPEPAPTPAPAPCPPTVPSPKEPPPVPPWTQPGPACNSPFAILETDRDTCDQSLENGAWKLYPRRQPKSQNPPDYDDKVKPPTDVKRSNVKPLPTDVNPPAPLEVKETDPRRSSLKSRPFCVYEWTAREKPTPEQFAKIHATQECALALAMGPPDPKVTRAIFSRNFDRQVIAMAMPEPSNAGGPLAKIAERGAVVAVLDTSPFGVTKPDVSGHGYAMSRIIGHVSCIGGADSPHCKDVVKPYVALPRVEQNGQWVPGPRGGFIGYYHDLHDAFLDALDERPRDGHLIINMSLGWDQATADADSPEGRNMRRLLEKANCLGALVIAAAGNGTTTTQAPLLPAALESAGGRDDKRRLPDAGSCKDEFGIANAKLPKGVYRPLIHAVGAVDLYDERLPTVRAWAHPRLAPYGIAVTTPDGSPEKFVPLVSGTSPGAAEVSAMAAWVWRVKPGLDASQVMEAVYKGGYALETQNRGSRTELCLDTKNDRCHSWPARRPTLCGALNAALGSARLRCVTPPHIERNDPKTPASYFEPRPTDPLTAPNINVPCGIANCGTPTGAPPAHGAVVVAPSGVPTCADCTIYANGGNGMMTGSMNFTGGTPPQWYSTTVVIYDSSWSPHYYYPFQWNAPAGWFWQGLPAGSTRDAIAAEIDWTYYAGSFWWTDGAPLMIAP